MRRSVRWRVTVALVVGMVVLVVPTPALAAPVGCGDVIWRDVTLTEDLHCEGDGLIVQRPADPDQDHITIDLDGHTISGDGTGTGISGSTDGYDDESVVVRDGTVDGFEWGIALWGHAPCRGVPRAGCGAGVADVVVRNNGTGLRLTGPPELHDVVIVGNGHAGLLGGYRSHDQEVPWERLWVQGNGDGVQLGAGGLRYPPIVDSAFVGNAGYGLYVFDAEARVRGSWFVGNGTGVRAEIGGADVERSVLWGNGIGIHNACCADARFRDSTFLANGVAVELATSTWGVGVAIERNQFLHNHEVAVRGVGVGPERAPHRIIDNVFVGNGFRPGAGALTQAALSLHADPAGDLVVTGNRFAFNAGLGADVSGSVVDDAGNVAILNGDRRQCVGITCSRR